MDALTSEGIEMPVKGGVDRTKRYCRYRQKNPSYFDEGSLRTKSVGKGTKIIVGCRKGFYKGGRCTRGMETQSILKEHKGRACSTARTFSGRSYKRFEVEWKLKSDAIMAKRRLKEQGFNARIVKSLGGWTVYYR